ncbi:MAG TPA: PmoA family protein [Cyclobacteriaceae bacterium]|nr:PmoA family protein [Cyclobacteriaceae bacterium]
MFRLTENVNKESIASFTRESRPGNPGLDSLRFVFILILLTVTSAVQAQKKKGFAFVDRPKDKQIDVMYNDQLLTSYCYYDSIMKPVLYPIKTISGVTVTRGFPLNPVPGERADHPHHIGLWLNYESVNGLDFWNNSTAKPYESRAHYGTIYHNNVVNEKASKKEASLAVSALWKNKSQETLLAEETQYNFQVKDSDFIIDRTTTLRAVDDEVVFRDVKDGFFAIRVATELELPANDKANLVGKNGEVMEQPSTDHSRATGNYLSSENLKGNDVWGTRGKWVTLSGKKDGKNISITIIDNPKNPGYPAYWHARDYGLFAVNPLGQEVFSKGKEKLNLTLKKGESVTFQYRVVIHEGDSLTPKEIGELVGSL